MPAQITAADGTEKLAAVAPALFDETKFNAAQYTRTPIAPHDSPEPYHALPGKVTVKV
jgi:hypothetical protein